MFSLVSWFPQHRRRSSNVPEQLQQPGGDGGVVTLHTEISTLRPSVCQHQVHHHTPLELAFVVTWCESLNVSSSILYLFPSVADVEHCEN